MKYNKNGMLDKPKCWRVYTFDNGRLHKPSKGIFFPKYEYSSYEAADSGIKTSLSYLKNKLQYLLIEYDITECVSSSDVRSKIVKIY